MESIPIRKFQQPGVEPGLSGDINIRLLDELLGGREMRQELHRHDFYFILALEKAEGKHDIDFMPYQAGNNLVFVMRPGQVHRLHLKHASGYLLQFSKAFYDSIGAADKHLLHQATRSNVVTLTPQAYRKLDVLLAGIFNETREKQQGWADITRASLSILFIELLRHRSDAHHAMSLYHTSRLEEFLTLLEQYAPSQKQVSFYADKLHLSLSQLNMITRKTVGKTSAELIHDQLILEAKRYLLATSDQVKEISYHLGFEDASYFIRFFRKQTGYTPEKFRSTFQ